MKKVKTSVIDCCSNCIPKPAVVIDWGSRYYCCNDPKGRQLEHDINFKIFPDWCPLPKFERDARYQKKK